ncbi:MAG: porin [Nitrospiraceae bacterium]
MTAGVCLFLEALKGATGGPVHERLVALWWSMPLIFLLTGSQPVFATDLSGQSTREVKSANEFGPSRSDFLPFGDKVSGQNERLSKMINPLTAAPKHLVQLSTSPGAQTAQPADPSISAPPVTVEAQKQRPASGQRPTAESTPLEDVLLEKGVITQEDWIRIKAEEERKSLELAGLNQMTGSPRWYERIRINGYTQMRYALGASTPLFDIPLGDRFATQNPNEFYLRRIRLVFQGQISERLAFFLQGAFEGTQQQFSNREIIDAYADYFLTKNKVHRLRFGLQRVPNAFDTYRSSTNRQELDRHESVQSGAPGERDLGIAYYWSPKIAQERFAQLAAYHNGPGDYGVFGVMVYNGSTRNRDEPNADKHVGLRLAYPWELPNGRLIETGVMAFRGIFGVTSVGQPTSTTAGATCSHPLNAEGACNVLDERITGYFWTPPQPWGILAEYTVGRGPKRNAVGIVEESHLYGGYVQGYYTWRYSDVGMLTPYIRWGEYYGGIKTISGADGRSRTWNFGLVWEPDTHWRFTTELMLKDGLNTTLVASRPQQEFDGSLVRFQAQWFWN